MTTKHSDTKLKELETQLAEAVAENAALKKVLKESTGLDDAGFILLSDTITTKAATVAGDVAGEIAKITGNEKLAKQIDDAVTDVTDYVGSLLTRYLAVPLRSMVLGDQPWDGANDWYLFDLGSDKHDDDLTVLEHPIGVYDHNTNGAPTHNDGAYGRTDTGAIAASGYELHFRLSGSESWSRTVPAKYIIENPHDPALSPGVYAMRYSQANPNCPDPKYSTGRFNRREPRSAWMIVQKTGKGELRAVQCYHGPRSWIWRDKT